MAAKRTAPKKKKQAEKSATAKKTTTKKSGTASRKAAAREKARGGKKGGAGQKRSGPGIKWDLALFLGILAAVALSAAFYHLYLKPSGGPQRRAAIEKQVPVIRKTLQKPDYEIFPEAPKPAPQRPGPPPPEAARKPPMVSIIIDDMGYEKQLADKFLSLDCPLTYAILPKSPYHAEIARRAHHKGCQVMLHLPMEPENYPSVDPGPGALLSRMSPNERIRMLKEDLNAVPYIQGVNNHMGSRMTANSAHMNQIISILKKRGLYFIDSRTTAETRALSSARLFHLPFAQRDVFLDHVPEPGAIRAQLRQLVAVARQNGRAVGIAHPYEATYRVLAEQLPELRRQVRLVPASEVVSVKDS